MHPNLIPRSTLFGNADKWSVTISPDGKYISYLTMLNGIWAMCVADILDISKVKLIIQNRLHGIWSYCWAYDNQHILYWGNVGDGVYDWHLCKVNLSTLDIIDLTPFREARGSIVKMSPDKPNEIIIALNKDGSLYSDLYSVDLSSGAMKLFYKNNERLSSFLLDYQYKLRFVSRFNDDGGRTFLEVDDKLNLKPFMEVDHRSINTYLVDLNGRGDILYLVDSRRSNTSSLFSYDLKSKTYRLLYRDRKSDIDTIIHDVIYQTILAVSTNYLKSKKYHILDKKIKEDIHFLERQQRRADLKVINADQTANYWVIAYVFDNKPEHYYLYNKKKMELQFLFTSKKELEQYELAKTKPVVIKSRDGLNLISYLTLPKSYTNNCPVPLILKVHGGPNQRDVWGLNLENQWLANRGYAVLEVNYRGSTGFGKKFVNAGDGEWGRKMHNDLIDACHWAVKNKITTKHKIGIYGSSYGGYAALVGLSFTPNLFACGIDVAGISNLVTFLKTNRSYGSCEHKALVKRTGGDPDTEEGQKFLLSRSPIAFAKNISKPLLIAHGVNDKQVSKAESDQMVAEMKKYNLPVTYLNYSDEEHGFLRLENKMSFYAVAEEFLAEHLGGVAEPIGDAFASCSLKVVEGEKVFKQFVAYVISRSNI